MRTRSAAVIFVAAIATANLLVAWLGPWFSPVNAFVLIGLDLSLRDWMHDQWRRQLWKMWVLIATAGVLSWVLNPAAGRIAVASTAAFTVAALVTQDGADGGRLAVAAGGCGVYRRVGRSQGGRGCTGDRGRGTSPCPVDAHGPGELGATSPPGFVLGC